MKKITLLTLLLLALSWASEAAAQKQKGTYLFGVAYSTTDSVAYITDIQYFDGMKINGKTGMLPQLDAYTAQWTAHVKKLGLRLTPVAAVFYAKDKKRAEKKMVRVRKQYTPTKRGKWVAVPQTDFSFTPVAP